MPEVVQPKKALATTWAAGYVADEAPIDGGETLRPPPEVRPPPTGDTLDETELPPITVCEGGELEPRGRLGTGGMAVVDRAWQRSLGREVAVKQAREPNSRARASMVREARVAGSLEHPNIVPVHALGRDEAGEAVIVMKRVSGEAWDTLLGDDQHPLWSEGDRLLRNLEILAAVCRAVEMAHRHGWLHRDIKAANVMIGEFGEIYLLDWGIAVPLAIAERGEAVFAGTPFCMAPEMAAAGRLTVQTDVFLLGGLLHTILTGEPLHPGQTLAALLLAALTPQARRYPSEVPAELIAIVERATEYHAADRYEDVASLRRALAGFVVHRGAIELAESATRELDAIDSGERADPRAARLEARTLLRQSLAKWPEADNERAHGALRKCVCGLAEQELAEGNASAAAGWAAELSPRDEGLDQRIAERAAALAAETEELAKLRGWAADRDVRQSASLRMRRTLGFAVSIALVGLFGGLALRAGLFELGYVELGSIQAVVAVFAFVAVAVGRRNENRVTRSLADVMLIASLSPFAALAAAWRLGLPAEAALGLDGLLKGGASIVLGAFVERSFRHVAAIYLATAAALFAFPETYPFEIAAGGLVLCLLAVARGLHAGKPPESSSP